MPRTCSQQTGADFLKSPAIPRHIERCVRLYVAPVGNLQWQSAKSARQRYKRHPSSHTLQSASALQTGILQTHGAELSLVNFEKIVNSLPDSAYHYFWCQLAVDKMNDEQLYQMIMMAASQLKEK